MWFSGSRTHSMAETQKPGTGNKKLSTAENMCG